MTRRSITVLLASLLSTTNAMAGETHQDPYNFEASMGATMDQLTLEPFEIDSATGYAAVSGDPIYAGQAFSGVGLEYVGGLYNIPQFSWSTFVCAIHDQANQVDHKPIIEFQHDRAWGIAFNEYNFDLADQACFYDQGYLVECILIPGNTLPNTDQFVGLIPVAPFDSFTLSASSHYEDFCLNDVWLWQDGDGDGFPPGEDDCDDIDPLAYTSNVETPYDGVDNDCNPNTRDDDVDEDGFNAADECADDNPLIHPDMTELCNGYDDNCDGVVDEGCDTGDGSTTGSTGDTGEGRDATPGARYPNEDMKPVSGCQCSFNGNAPTPFALVLGCMLLLTRHRR